MKKILGIVLSLVLVFTTLGTSFANTNNNLIRLSNGNEMTVEELIIFFDNYEGEITKVSDSTFQEDTDTDTNTNPQQAAVIAIPFWAVGKWVIPLIGTVIITPAAIYIGETVVEAGSKLFNSILSAIENLFLSESGERVQGVLKDKQHDRKTSSGTDIYVGSGGYSEAESDFEDLNEGDSTTYPNGTKVGQLPDGTSINVRKQSSDSRVTLEIQGKYKIKIRYE